MNNKYYTPQIEEFRIGFECEMHTTVGNEDMGWTKQILNASKASGIIRRLSLYTAEQSGIRVKYLDQNDIEECGFKLIKSYSDELIFQLQDGDYSFYELGFQQEEDFKICIEHWQQNKLCAKVLPLDQWSCFNIFLGTVKNTSELKLLLNMLGINK